MSGWVVPDLGLHLVPLGAALVGLLLESISSLFNKLVLQMPIQNHMPITLFDTTPPFLNLVQHLQIHMKFLKKP